MRWILFGPFLVLLILFALSNRQEVQLTLWPFDYAYAVPLSFAVLAVAALSFLIGAAVAWIASLPYRRRARQMEGAARRMETQLAGLRTQEVYPARRQAEAKAMPAPPAAPSGLAGKP
ncbi:LapA family protein [Roseomonas sp. NAR14]|uniref:LapA family protein n=1 Tax=Roseomonas acroporae TaxID=2937791 RepID=A0A9X1YA38_9PROT|nr:LapA family protein [Roseomonas acroporae]MCK8785180.1 LapA family protein [Roseomonas acroporae]